MLLSQPLNFIKLVLKNVIKRAFGELNNIFQDSFNKILFQPLTYDRSYMSIIDGLTLYQTTKF